MRDGMVLKPWRVLYTEWRSHDSGITDRRHRGSFHLQDTPTRKPEIRIESLRWGTPSRGYFPLPNTLIYQPSPARIHCEQPIGSQTNQSMTELAYAVELKPCWCLPTTSFICLRLNPPCWSPPQRSSSLDHMSLAPLLPSRSCAPSIRPRPPTCVPNTNVPSSHTRSKSRQFAMMSDSPLLQVPAQFLPSHPLCREPGKGVCVGKARGYWVMMVKVWEMKQSLARWLTE